MKQWLGVALQIFITRNNVNENLIIKEYKTLKSAMLFSLETSEDMGQRGWCNANLCLTELPPSFWQRKKNKENQNKTLSSSLKLFT